MPEENIQPTPTISPELSQTKSSGITKKSTRIILIVLLLLVIFGVSALAYTQYDKVQKSKFADLNPTPSPTVQPTVTSQLKVTVSATSTPTPPMPTLAMSFQDLITTYCKKINFPAGGYTYEFVSSQLPVTVSTGLFSFTENSCSPLLEAPEGYGGYIDQQLSNDHMVTFINNQSLEPGHGGSPFWDPIGIEIYNSNELTVYTYLPSGDVGPGPTISEVYLDIRGIRNMTLSNGEEISLILTETLLIPKGNSQLMSIMQKYTQEISFEDGSGDSMVVIDTAKDSLYYEEIYNTFFKDLSKTDSSIKSVMDTVTNTLNSFVPR